VAGWSSETLQFEAAASDPRDRLDKLVVALLERAGRPASRSTVQRWIANGHVLVNEKPARAGASVLAGSVIAITPGAPEATTATPDASIALEVVYEDAHLIVINKPAGLVVHPARGHADGTLVNALLARGDFDRASADPRDPVGHLRPGIVHRLDKGTSGLLVVAKDAETREALKAQFARHAIEREYVAIALGEAKDATFDTLHGRHPTDRLRFTSLVTEGRRAVTHVRVLERIGRAEAAGARSRRGAPAKASGCIASLVACRLSTGRTHQIRVHLAERARTPILGDPLYSRAPKEAALAAIAEELGRQALHARVLGFIHPATGNAVRWESPMPADMERALGELRALGHGG
jgi:23S rRNA pseudouridine1911/1915/1917 synthase